MAFVIALAVAAVATPIAARSATALGVVDHPGALKVHARPVPYLGGVAVFVAVAGPIGVHRATLLVPLALVLALGIADDVREVPPPVRVASEVAVGVVAGLVAPAPGPLALGATLTALAFVGLVNAVNLLDGLDGLAAGVVGVAALGFAFVDAGVRVPALALAGACAGFLLYNRPPARIYLGDGGAYLLGASLALLGSRALDARDELSVWVALPLLVAVPVADTAVAIVRRRRSRRPLTAGDRSHLYDQLVDRGSSPVRAVLRTAALQAALAAIAVVLAQVAGPWAVAGAAVTLVGLVVGLVVGGFVAVTPEAAA